MAAEAYARMDNRMAAVCVTTVWCNECHYQVARRLDGFDSYAGFFRTGKICNYGCSVRLKLRSMGVQECNIVPVVTSVQNMHR